jgi:hypothetical protein
MLLVEIGDEMQAFGAAEKLAAWACVCPGAITNRRASAREAGDGKAILTCGASCGRPHMQQAVPVVHWLTTAMGRGPCIVGLEKKSSRI